MKYFCVVNWEKHQHYKDRSPPWIKLQNRLLDHYEFGRLQDASKAHLIGIWLLASRHNNKLPFDPVWVGQRIQAVSKVKLTDLQDAGFIELLQVDSGLLAEGEQDAILEGETEEEKRKRREEEKRRKRDAWRKSFSTFWSAYPRKLKKETAKDSWMKYALDEVTLQTILDALAWQTQSDQWTRDRAEFIPHPTTYLNQKRWEDEPEAPKESSIDQRIRLAEEQEGKRGLLRIT